MNTIKINFNARSRRWKRHGVMLMTAGLIAFQFTMTFCQEKPSAADSLKYRFESELEKFREQYRFPGATAAYILPDGTIGAVATGLADVEAQIPMTPASRMLAASIGKTFTGAVAVALSLENRLKFDEPISYWLRDRPWFRRLPNHESITLRHLLNHTSGIPDHVEMAGFQADLSKSWQTQTSPFSPEELVSYILDLPALCKPGEAWHYSDTGYILVGMIIEAVTGRRYYEEVTCRFLEPLHLELTSPSDRRELPDFAAGYLAPDNAFHLPEKTISQPGVMAWHPGVEWTGGGLISNPKDLVVWAKALYEGKAMPGNYLEILLNAAPISKEHPDLQYGIGVGIHQNGPFGTMFGHGGWIPGYCSSLRYYPQYGVAIAFQINTDIGIMNSTTPVIEKMEQQLAEIVIAHLVE